MKARLFQQCCSYSYAVAVCLAATTLIYYYLKIRPISQRFLLERACAAMLTENTFGPANEWHTFRDLMQMLDVFRKHYKAWDCRVLVIVSITVRPRYHLCLTLYRFIIVIIGIFSLITFKPLNYAWISNFLCKMCLLLNFVLYCL